MVGESTKRMEVGDEYDKWDNYVNENNKLLTLGLFLFLTCKVNRN
jgi:hypothetical protein